MKIREKSSGFRAGQRVFRDDTKSTVLTERYCVSSFFFFGRKDRVLLFLLMIKHFKWSLFLNHRTIQITINKKTKIVCKFYFCFTDYAKAFHCVDHNKLWKILK